MSGINFLSTVIICVVVFIIAKTLYINYKRNKLMAQPTDLKWIDIVKNTVAVYKYLPDNLKEELHALMRVFIAEKNFEGCGGLEMTDEIKITIAAEACVLMLNRKPRFYPNLYSILVYPSSYFAKDIEPLSGRYTVVSESLRMGESWRTGMVILAWDHVKRGALDMDDGHNVVFHEFAHQLDEEDEESANGVPVLKRPSSYVLWARIFCKEFQKLRRDVYKNNKTVLDEYGATNPAEFFAVATESFFEKSQQLKQKHPKLYRELKEYYNLDPVSWMV